MPLLSRRTAVMAAVLATTALATGCLELEATISRDRPSAGTATADGTCRVFRPRADATVIVEGTESSDPDVTVFAYTLPPLGAGRSDGVIVWSGRQGRRARSDTVSGGQLYNVVLSGNELQPTLPGAPPAPAWTTHVKVTVTAEDAAGNDVPLDCAELPTPPPPDTTDTTNRGH
jgi:hypothetical protein